MNQQLEKDFRKWILFNKNLKDFQSLYELYKAVQAKSSTASVSIQSIDNASGESFMVEQAGHDISLAIENEPERKDFLAYIEQNYFPDQEVEEWYQSKLQIKDKQANHQLQAEEHNNKKKDFNFKVHPKESQYYKLRVFFSGLFYLGVVGALIIAFTYSTTYGFTVLGSIIGVVLFIAFGKMLSQGFFIGYIKGSAVKLNEEQYPEVYRIIKAQAEEMGLNDIPETYIIFGHFNAFVTKFARKRFLVLHSEVIETALRGDFEILKFIIGHELGHIKRKHLHIEKWLIPSNFVPFLSLAHSRGCEYTCDRIGAQFSVKGALEGILILATGKEIFSKIDMNQYMKDSYAENNFWVWISEKFLTHPYTFKRMTMLKNYLESSHSEI